MIPLDDTTSLSLLFHLNSEPWGNDNAYQAVYHQDFKKVTSPVSHTALPAPRETAFARLIRLRRSCRAFRADPLPVDVLATLASASAGAVELASLDNGARFLRRSVPSAGGLYPIELFISTDRVTGIDNGLYHYDIAGHALDLMDPSMAVPHLEPVLYTYSYIKHANAVFVFSAVFDRTQKKYGPRGYRYILLEAGHAAQNLCLAAAELGLGTLCMGGFTDSGLNRVLSLDPQKEGVIYAVAVGAPA